MVMVLMATVLGGDVGCVHDDLTPLPRLVMVMMMLMV